MLGMCHAHCAFPAPQETHSGSDMKRPKQQSENPYLRDRDMFLKSALRAVKADLDFPELVIVLLNFALGFERLFKGILHEVNPVYLLQDESFKNSAPLLYKHKFDLAGQSTKSFESTVAENPCGDVLAFRAALFRCCLFSAAINKNKGRLMRLNGMRDIIAHRLLAELDLDKCRSMILGDAFNVLRDLEAAHILDLSELAGKRLATLQRLAIGQSEDVSKRVEEILKFHEEFYRRRQKRDGRFERILKDKYSERKVGGDYWIPCPACGNTAEVHTEIDYDWCDHEAVPIGIFITRLRCAFCKLDVDDYEELQQMGVTMESLTPDEGEDF